ncbi:MAG TPA: hypothetical protein VN968_19220 [Bradyrhizobium sp.]|jgi:hypothetical protein|nr:hypothetical protein [Bradyrhizobium sp.]
MLVTAIAKEKQSGGARLHHSERVAFHRQRVDQKKLRIAAADLSVLGFKAHFDHAPSIRRLIMDHHAVYVGRQKKSCLASSTATGTVESSSKKALEEPGFTTCACTPVGEPDLVLAGLPPMTP